ncbi:hypothetical protein [Sphingomonas paucimobilis]|jgi:hypothetical protein|uniref:Uncharacterized protein n=1 Tax=Sphingomonas paucimobilis TaxID=13689 RepID=A0A7Y2PE87_SPHPI|nr:hypothetical protein [Sphingomonas paucimobilis]NNG58568.1 hypothetical protein [Sphingomonas paucimobilis]
MSDVAPFDRHRRFTDMSVMEFALLIALMRAGPHPLAFLLPTLDAWFDCKLGVSDLEPTAGRLVRANYVLRRGDTLYPRRHTARIVMGLYGSLFRILADDVTKLVSAQEPNMLSTMKAYLDRKASEEGHQHKDGDR